MLRMSGMANTSWFLHRTMGVGLHAKFLALLTCFLPCPVFFLLDFPITHTCRLYRSRSRVNGATQTFRRPSQAAASSQPQNPPRESASTSSANTNNGGVYIPPHLNTNNPSGSSRNLPLGDTRYSKDQLLNVYQTLKESAALDRDLGDIFLGSWDPVEIRNRTASQGGRLEGKDQIPGPEVCWNYNANLEPFGLTSMTEEDKQVRGRTFQRGLWTWLISCGSSFLLLSTRQSNCSRVTRKKVLAWE